MKLTSKLLGISTICLFTMGGAYAATDTDSTLKNQYDAAISQANANYTSATTSCKSMQGNDKDVCMQQAKADRDKAKADAKAARKSGEAMATAHDDRADADYQVAKQKCDALSGDEKDACISNAKVKYHQ